MNVVVKLIREFKERDNRRLLKDYRDKVELIRKRNFNRS